MLYLSLGLCYLQFLSSVSYAFPTIGLLHPWVSFFLGILFFLIQYKRFSSLFLCKMRLLLMSSFAFHMSGEKKSSFRLCFWKILSLGKNSRLVVFFFSFSTERGCSTAFMPVLLPLQNLLLFLVVLLYIVSFSLAALRFSLYH